MVLQLGTDYLCQGGIWRVVFGGGTRYGISELEVRAWQGVGVCRVQVGVKVSGVDLVNDQGKY